MRKLTLAAFALTIAGSVFAQGTVVFSSYNYLGTVHYWGASATSPPMLSLQGNSPTDTPAGTTDYAAAGMTMLGTPGSAYGASTTFAQLLWANGPSQPADSLRPGGQTTTFRTGNTVGRITFITDTITGLTPDSAAATFAMVAWDNSSGQYADWTTASRAWMSAKIAAGESTAITVNAIGGSFNTPPIVMLPSFNIWPSPEPSTGALALLGLGCLLLLRRRKLIVAAFALTIAGSVFAQGTVVFSSYNYLGTVHYWGASATAPDMSLLGNSPTDTPAGTTDYAAAGMTMLGTPGSAYGAATTFAQLLWANGANQPANSLVPGGQTTTFRTGNTVGRISMITDTITGLTPDSAAATFAMVAWDNSSGRFPTWTQASVGWMAGQTAAGESAAITVNAIGGSVNTPPIVMLPSFNLYPGPEPSTGALALVGLGCLFLFRRRKLIVAAFALTVAGSVFAQGTVVFSSYNSLGTVHYWGSTMPIWSLQGNGPTDTPVGPFDYAAHGMIMIGAPGGYSAATTFAQLLWANGASQPLDSLVPGGQTTTFRTGNTVGRISLITDTIIGLTPDSAAATFAMVAWDNSSGQYPTWTQASAAWDAGKIAAGESTAFSVNNIGGSLNVPPVMLPPSFDIFPWPEPSTGALTLLGLGCLLLCRRRKLIVAAFALTVAGGVFAQGTVAFSSYNSLGTVHYWVASPTAPWQSLSGNSAADSPAGTTDYEHYGMMLIGSTGTGGHWGSSTTFAQLLWANGASQPLNSLVPGGQTTTFRTGNTVGRFTAITDTITGLTPDSDAATFALVIWDNSSGQYPTWTQASVAWLFGKIGAGESSAFTVNNIGGTANVPPICMAPSFNIWPSPEPSYGALALLGLGCLGLFRRRKLVLGAFALTVAGSVFAQGTVIFGCYNSLGTTHFWAPSTNHCGLSLVGNAASDIPAGTTDYAGMGLSLIGSTGLYGRFGAATTFAQLLWANGANQPADSLVPGGQTTTFRTGNTVGRISLITDTIDGLIPDSAAATFAMVMWDNSSGLYPTWTQASVAWMSGKLWGAAEGPAFTVYNIGGTANTPPNMLPPSFNIYWLPEPATGALAGLGLACVLLFRRKRSAGCRGSPQTAPA